MSSSNSADNLNDSHVQGEIDRVILAIKGQFIKINRELSLIKNVLSEDGYNVVDAAKFVNKHLMEEAKKLGINVDDVFTVEVPQEPEERDQEETQQTQQTLRSQVSSDSRMNTQKE